MSKTDCAFPKDMSILWKCPAIERPKWYLGLPKHIQITFIIWEMAFICLITVNWYILLVFIYSLIAIPYSLLDIPYSLSAYTYKLGIVICVACRSCADLLSQSFWKIVNVLTNLGKCYQRSSNTNWILARDVKQWLVFQKGMSNFWKCFVITMRNWYLGLPTHAKLTFGIW